MDQQSKSLGAHFFRYPIPEGKEEEFGDENVGECWTRKEPEQVEYWSIVFAPMTAFLSFTTKYKNCQETLPVSLHESIVEVSYTKSDLIIVSCKTKCNNGGEDYLFSYIVPALRTTFSISATCRSYQDTDLSAMATDLGKHIDEKRWVSTNGGALPPRSLASRLNKVLNGHDKLLEKIKAKAKNMTPLTISKEYGAAGGSHGSPTIHITESGRSKTKRKSTAQEGREKPEETKGKGPTTRGKAAAEALAKNEDNIASVVTVLPKDVTGAEEEINYEESRKTYEEYWSSYTNLYVFGQGTKFKIPIEQLEIPPETLNIRALEERGVNKCLHYFLEMPDPDKKMTLCAMPQGLKEKPQSFNDIKSCKFWMVNGQHKVKASKRMKNLFIAEKKFENFKEWECFIVWNKNGKVIRKISAYYNRVNHFQSYLLTWLTNILSARNVWISLGRPAPPKEPTDLGKTVTVRKKADRPVAKQTKWLVGQFI